MLLTDNDWVLLYIVVSLVVWLVLEMTGEMAKGRKDVVDGAAFHFLIVVLWLPMLIVVPSVALVTGICISIEKASKIKLF